MNIRLAEFSDAAAISAVQRRSWAHVYSPEMVNSMLSSLSLTQHQRLWQQRLRSKTKQTWVLAKREVVGFMMLDFSEQPIELSAFYLCPTVIGKGNGRIMFEHLRYSLTRSNQRQLSLWVMDDNQHAIEVYLHLGFQFTGETRSGSLWQQNYLQKKAQIRL